MNVIKTTLRSKYKDSGANLDGNKDAVDTV